MLVIDKIYRCVSMSEELTWCREEHRRKDCGNFKDQGCMPSWPGHQQDSAQNNAVSVTLFGFGGAKRLQVIAQVHYHHS